MCASFVSHYYFCVHNSIYVHFGLFALISSILLLIFCCPVQVIAWRTVSKITYICQVGH